MLQEGKEPVEDRLARAYLEVLFCAVERKKTTGRMLGKDSEAYLADANALKSLQTHAASVFGEPIKDAQGRDTLRSQHMPGLEDCVAWLMRFLKTAHGTADHRAIYDYVSNLSHPTLYPHIEMWQPAERDGQQTIVSKITIEDHERLAALAIVPFCETLSYVMSYNRWPRGTHERLIGILGKLLPSAVAPASR